MIRKSLSYTWDEATAWGGVKPDPHELTKLIDKKRELIQLKLQVQPIVALDATDFWDFVVIGKVDHYSAEGIGEVYAFEDQEEVRRQIDHVLKSRFGVRPDGFRFSGSIDDTARGIVRYIERCAEDELWSCAA